MVLRATYASLQWLLAVPKSREDAPEDPQTPPAGGEPPAADLPWVLGSAAGLRQGAEARTCGFMLCSFLIPIFNCS